MYKKILIFILLIIPFNVCALNYPKLNSKYVLIYDNTDKNVLYEKDSNEITPIASLTKIITTITALETIDNLDEEVTITKEILNTVNPYLSKAGLKAGDKVTYRDLLYASIIPSGADATNSIAILTSGSIDNFVKKMNDLVTKLDLKNTHFVNVTGLDATNHYSTASDIQKILSYALDNKLFREIFTTKDYTLSNNLKVKSTLYKYNTSLKKDLSNILGSKTGYTSLAGYCIATISNTLDHEIIIILINAPSEEKIPYHLIDDLNLIDFINHNYNNQVLYEKNSISKTIPVKYGSVDNYEVTNNQDVIKFLPNDYDPNNITYIYEGKNELSYRDTKGTKIGTLSYYYNNELISTEDIILNDNIQINYLKIIKDYYYFPLIIGFLLLLIIKKKKTS